MAALRSISLEGSAFGADSQRLVARGRKYGSALMAVMRKMLAVAAHLLLHEGEEFDPTKVAPAPPPTWTIPRRFRLVLKRKEGVIFPLTTWFLRQGPQGGLTISMASLPYL
jgi:hypothetical protein